MQRFRNILIGVDLSYGDRLAASELSDSTREAIRAGLWLGSKSKAQVTFFAGLDISAQTEELIAHDVEHLTHSVDDDALEVLRHIQQQAADRHVHSEIHIAHGHSWDTIIRKVIKDEHDLVIVGTRNRSAVDRMLFGSTGVKLLRYCPCPVWLTKPVPEDKEVYNVLVADDLQEVGMECLKLAINGGQLLTTRTHVLHVVEEEPSGGLFGSKIEPEQRETIRQKKIEAAEKQVYERLAQTDYRTLPLGVMLHVVSGRADEQILKAIDEHEIDLLIMGTKARTGLSGMLIGNTAERLLTQIPCSLLAVKPAGFHCPISAD